MSYNTQRAIPRITTEPYNDFEAAHIIPQCFAFWGENALVWNIPSNYIYTMLTGYAA